LLQRRLVIVAFHIDGPAGGRSWWAHLEVIPINIERIILKNQIEENPDVL
jgi:hypothetical protein